MNPCVLASQGSGGNLMKKHMQGGGEHLLFWEIRAYKHGDIMHNPILNLSRT